MSKHRLLSLFLAIVMMFSCVSTQLVTANAIGNPTFTVSSGTGNPGEDVTITVDISNNPGICTATIWVHYDEGLTLKSATDSRLLVGGLFGGDKTANPYGLGWDDSANFDGDNSSNGTLATLVFTIDPSATAGDYDVWVTYNYGDIYNLDFDDFDFDTVAGKITVKGAACEHKNTEIRDAVTGNCKDAGYTGDTWCKDCNTKIADGQTIPATGNHIDTDGKWESNGTQHFHTCSCGTEFDKTNHSGGTATCKVQANCAACGTAYGELDNKNHVNTEVRDAVTESCNTAGYTGDTWCKDCNTKVTDGASIPATGNHIDADGKWESDGRQHFRTCSCGTKFDFADHTGGTATCKEKAVCTICDNAYGSLNSSNHIGGTHLVGQKETSCYEEGYTGDTYCSGCNTKIADGQSIPKSDHSPASVWSTDNTYHWHECDVIACGNIVDKAEHSGGEATCKDKAICSVCKIAYGSLNNKNHKNTEIRDAVTESCNEAGYTGDTWCKDCETKIADGQSIPATGNHIDADGKWESNGTQHFHTCSCGTEFDKTNHSGGTATCKDKAICSICETAYGDLNNKNHVGGTHLVGQKETSCYEEGYTGDTYCSGCNTKIADGQSIPKSDHSPASVWSTDNTYHWHECDVIACGNIVDKAEHSGGTATCSAKAVCSVCNVAYGSFDSTKHVNTEIRDAATESCNEAGYTGDTWCKDCNTKIADGQTIPATGNHVDADNKWESNGTQHYHTCGCGTKFDYTNHTGGTATCKDKAICSICETAYGDLNNKNHVGGTHLVGQKETSCYEEGYTGDTYCSGCNTKIADGQTIPTSEHNPASVWSADDTYHWHECDVIACGNIVDKAEHSGGTATCSAKAVCSVCNVAYGSLDSNKHVNTEIRDAVEMSCEKAGYTGDTWCKDCETKIADGNVIPAAHKTTKVPAVNATHFENGNIEYFACSNCEKLFADEKATTEIKLEDTVVAKGEHSYGEEYEKDADNHWKQCGCGNMIEKSAHTFGEWATIKEATESEKGSKEKTCSVCGYKVTEEIPVVEDDDKEDVPNTDPNSPQTGDTSNLPLWIALLIVSGCCLTVCTVSNRRKKHNR